MIPPTSSSQVRNRPGAGGAKSMAAGTGGVWSFDSAGSAASGVWFMPANLDGGPATARARGCPIPTQPLSANAERVARNAWLTSRQTNRIVYWP